MRPRFLVKKGYILANLLHLLERGNPQPVRRGIGWRSDYGLLKILSKNSVFWTTLFLWWQASLFSEARNLLNSATKWPFMRSKASAQKALRAKASAQKALRAKAQRWLFESVHNRDRPRWLHGQKVWCKHFAHALASSNPPSHPSSTHYARSFRMQPLASSL